MLGEQLWSPEEWLGTSGLDQDQFPEQGNLIQGKAQLLLKNWKNLFGDQREESLTSSDVW